MANTAVVTGTIFGEPSFAYTQQGKAVVNFKVTTGSKNKDGSYSNIQYDCSLWNEAAETFVKFFHDGSPIVINGPMKEIRIWTNKDGSLYADKNGNPRASITMGFINWDFVPQSRGAEFSGPPNVSGGTITDTQDAEYGG